MKTVDELNVIRQEYQHTVAIRTSNYETRIIVGMGNSGLVAGAREILKAIIKKVKADGLYQDGRVIVTQEARISRAGKNPVVKIVENGVKTAVYQNVTVEKAEEIVDRHIKNGEIIKEYLLEEETV